MGKVHVFFCRICNPGVIITVYNTRKREVDDKELYGMEILKTIHLKKHYGSGENLVKAVDDISFSVEKGSFTAVVGTSGSGKTTLLNLIGGLDYADDGEVIIGGQSIMHMKEEELTVFRRRNIGFVFQNYNLISVLDVYKNITLPIRLDGNKPDEGYIRHICGTLGIEEKMNRYPNQLSGGQQQRTAIGRAIIKNPDILLCDEPTGALDYQTSKEILKLIEQVNHRYGNTIIMVTHNDAIRNMADRIIKLRDGQIRSNSRNEAKIPAAELEW